jgi:hypothetical protein
MNKKTVFTLCVLFPVLCILTCSPPQPGWEGAIESIDGVQVIKNPLAPLYGEDAFLVEEELVIGEAAGREEYMFQSIRSLAVSETGDIFVLDSRAQHLKVFDKEGQYLRTMGSPGQGPGEFQAPLTVIFNEQDEVVVGDMNRISYFFPDGEYIKSIPLSTASLMRIGIDSSGNILGYSIARDEGVYELNKYDPELNVLCSYGSSPLPTTEYRKTGKRNPFFTMIRWDIINGDQVVTGYPEEGYILRIMDSEGTLVRKIEKEYTPVEITQEEVEEAIREYPADMRKDMAAPKFFPPFWTMSADDEGRIWVYTSERAAEGEKRIFDVFDAEGKYILRVALKASPQIFKNKLYCIEEDDEGFQYVKRYNIVWRIEE